MTGRQRSVLHRIARSHAIVRARRAAGDLIYPHVSRSNWEWRSRPPDAVGANLCIFVTCSPDDGVSAQARDHARRWYDAGYTVVLVVQAKDIAAVCPRADFAHILVRENKGYDFAAWATAIHHIPSIEDAAVVALVNDSIYGPGSGFSEMLARVEHSNADMIGLVESHENGWHLQSFLMFFKNKALGSGEFWEFWRGIRLGGRRYVIDSYELQLSPELRNCGLTIETLFPLPVSPGNPTLASWKELIEAGFPYVKRQLLRANPTGEDLGSWQTFLAGNGFDVELISADLAGIKR